ncbi:MAG TPA: universal stress protein [Solirubrobacteraceae bacterium]|nr:universal stress protein [Solirubrobacteraceae bacterium]
MARVIVSYDGTRNDRDALALGRLFAKAGAQVSLAYVRHAAEPDSRREQEAQAQAEHLLAVGADEFDGSHVGQYVIVNRSTAEGLAELATELGAEVIAFGSSYRSPPGHVEVPHTAEQLLDLGVSCSLALAPAGLRREPVEQSIGTVALYDEHDDEAAQATAKSLAHALGAVLTSEEADLLVIASRADTPVGHLRVGADEREQIERAVGPVLALVRGAELTFG